ncbi:hypothetical protein [Vibrio sp. JPW-9-11-11]|nr:hypothetical protein [Vibrio sp. JPW-9-11-11]
MIKQPVSVPYIDEILLLDLGLFTDSEEVADVSQFTLLNHLIHN